jgi:plastocyanin domain-containing protein
MRKQSPIQVLPLLFLAIILAAIALAQNNEKAPQEPYTATVGPDGVQHVDILAGSYFFRPNYIIVKENVPVEFSVRKEKGLTPHRIVMHYPDAGMDFRVKLGTDPEQVRFTPTKSGKYEFYCDEKLLFFPSHRSQGMHGILEVVK